MPYHSMRHVGFFQKLPIAGVQLDRERANELIELLHPRDTNDGSRHAGLAGDPRQGNLNGLHALPLGQLDDAIGNVVVRWRVVQRVAVVIVLLPDGGVLRVPLAIPGEEAARERTPWNQSDALVTAERDHLALLFAVD